MVKEEPFYFVRVPAGTAVARPIRDRDDRARTNRADAAVRYSKPGVIGRDGKPPGGPGGGTGPIIIQCPLVCRIEMELLRSTSGERQADPASACPLLFCRQECPSEPA